MGSERVWDVCQRLIKMFCQHFLIRNVLRYLSEPVHVVRKGEQLGGYVTDFLKCAPHHRRTLYFTEGTNMGQARGSVACFKKHIALLGHLAA